MITNVDNFIQDGSPSSEVVNSSFLGWALTPSLLRRNAVLWSYYPFLIHVFYNGGCRGLSRNLMYFVVSKIDVICKFLFPTSFSFHFNSRDIGVWNLNICKKISVFENLTIIRRLIACDFFKNWDYSCFYWR